MNIRLSSAFGAVLLSMVFLSTAYTQPTGAAPQAAPRDGRRMERMATELGLSEEQRAKIAAIMEKHRAEMEASNDDRQEARQGLRSEIESVLTPEQRAKMRAQQAERRKRFEERREQRRGNGERPRRD